MSRFHKTLQIIRFNFNTLIIFEIIYRLVGLAIIFPLARQLFYWTITLTGDQYIINRDFVEYLFSPFTILIMIVLILIVGLYITYEVVALSVLFHSSHYQDKLGLQTLFIASFRKMRFVIVNYHITIIISSMIFLVIVEGLHVVGIASTIQIPSLIIDQLRATGWFYPLITMIVLTVFILFFETIFYELQCSIEHITIRDNFKHSRSILKHNRGKMLFQFIIINGGLNLFLYILYGLFLGVVAVFVLIIRGESAVFGVILTVLYTIYLIIGFFASIILIPINFAWINTWYYERKQTLDKETQAEISRIRRNRPFSNRSFGRILSVISLFLLAITILSFFNQSNSPERIAFLNNPRIISHRGGGDFGPENTLSAIEQGIEFGADAVEIDVRFTSDNIPVLMHDETLGRTTNDGLNRKVVNVTLEELKQLDAGSWFDPMYEGESIPTLQEALDFIDHRVDVYIELKAPTENLEQIILSIIEEAHMENNVKILSFNGLLLEQIKMENEDIETVLLLRNFLGDINALANNRYIDYFAFHHNTAVNNIEYVRVLQQAGKGVIVWTVNDDTQIDTVNNLGVDGIITDTPLIAREIVYSDTTKSFYRVLLEKLFTRY